MSIVIIVTGFTGISTVVIQCAGAEILRIDSCHLAEGLLPAGGQVELDQHPGRWHDFQLDAGLMLVGSHDGSPSLEVYAPMMRIPGYWGADSHRVWEYDAAFQRVFWIVR